jgi:hypothetical protein
VTASFPPQQTMSQQCLAALNLDGASAQELVPDSVEDNNHHGSKLEPVANLQPKNESLPSTEDPPSDSSDPTSTCFSNRNHYADAAKRWMDAEIALSRFR